MTQPSPVPEPRSGTPTGIAALDPARVAVLRSLATRGGAHIVAELADLFTTTSREDVAAMVAAYEQHDRVKLDELAHKLKGAARSLGATALADLCARVEGTLRDGAEVAPVHLVEMARETEFAGTALLALAASVATSPLR